RNLKWLKKDFTNPSTSDVIIDYFKEKYPSDYEGKCQILLGMDAEKFKAYEKRRDDFFNK
ncbi:MAG TPA: hypothetical protein VHS53_16060, partial [Mucilaginibacter sp.]|nr:hypothetical protein [Mucilaginibacter sp.]